VRKSLGQGKKYLKGSEVTLEEYSLSSHQPGGKPEDEFQVNDPGSSLKIQKKKKN
jgi:hypothetical protein